MAKFSDYLKNIFFLLILLQFAPPLVKSIIKQYKNLLEPKTKVGLIEIKGVLYKSSKYTKYLKKYFKDSDIKAILLKIESPGGAAGTSEEVAQEIAILKKEYPKPIITLTENVCASGGYYIACTTDHIIAPPSALIGSIGTYIPYQFKLKDFIEQFKIQYQPIKAGEYKTATDPFVDATPETTTMLQNIADSSYKNFTQHVAKYRPKLTLAQKDTWANGRIFTGSQALELGIIDEIGSRSTAVKKIKELAIIEKEIEWVKPKKTSNFMRLLTGQEYENDDDSLMSKMINKACESIEQRYREVKINS